MENCIFCKIINHEIPAYTIYEDDDIVAFLDIAQSTYGHTLVVPKKHFANLLEVEENLLQKSMIVAKKIAIQQMQTLPNIKGINVINNCNEVSGQMVMHFHIHVIPRYQKDDMCIKSFLPCKLSKDQFIELKNKLEMKQK